MPAPVFEKAAASLLGRWAGIRRVKFIGGEPLLRFALVKRGIIFINSLGFSPVFEVGTNGLLMDSAKAAFFRGRPGVQLNVNAAFGVRKIFSGLPNVMWNLCISPGQQGAAVALLGRIAALSKKTRHRVNLLPAYYCDWTPAQLNRLKGTARELRAFIGRNNLLLENTVRTGSVPLFNDGPAVDVDGRVYRSNLCLAAMSQRLREKLLRPAGIGRRELVAVFGLRAVAASFAADRIMNGYA